ncbi:hypothetical protein EDC01DRAFT_635344 [Geopyxis carbonaria]|nr:hypothetical protein EDC01DRAFT_635344 [Geopyxis carbonaria]
MDWESTAANKAQAKFYAATMQKQWKGGDKQGSSNTNKALRCYECGKLGHVKRDCYTLKNRLNGRNDNSRRKQEGRRPAFRKATVDPSSDKSDGDHESDEDSEN